MRHTAWFGFLVLGSKEPTIFTYPAIASHKEKFISFHKSVARHFTVNHGMVYFNEWVMVLERPVGFAVGVLEG